MTHIIAGHFQQQDQVQLAIEKLVDAGFPADQISSFYVNPPGQHDLYIVGGDRDISPGAKESGHGVVVGAARGSLIGVAVGVVGTAVASPVGPIVGALVGAHIGSLVGSLAEMKDRDEKEEGDENVIEPRQTGMLVAVSVPEPSKEKNAVGVLQSVGAEHIEHAEGTIAQGNWEDFNPLIPPVPWRSDIHPSA